MICSLIPIGNLVQATVLYKGTTYVETEDAHTQALNNLFKQLL